MSETAPVAPAVEACKRDRIKEVLAYSAVGTMILVIVLVFVKGLPSDQAVLVIVGGIISSVMLNVKEVYGFVFGSSQGSQDKNDQIAAITAPPTTEKTQ